MTSIRIAIDYISLVRYDACDGLSQDVALGEVTTESGAGATRAISLSRLPSWERMALHYYHRSTEHTVVYYFFSLGLGETLQ